MLTLKYLYIYGLLVFYSCVTSLDICNCCNPPSLAYIHLYSCLTRTLLLLFLLCVCACVCRLTGLVESVEESEGLRRDGAWRVAGEGSWWSTATRAASYWCMSVLRRHVLACRSVSVCHLRGRWEMHVIWWPLMSTTQPSLSAYGRGACSRDACGIALYTCIYMLFFCCSPVSFIYMYIYMYGYAYLCVYVYVSDYMYDFYICICSCIYMIYSCCAPVLYVIYMYIYI
jgi:hypothetical protein